MTFTQNVMLLSARRYNLKDDDGKTVSGTSIQYYPDNNLFPHVNSSADEYLGQKVIDDSVSYEMFKELGNVPGIYEASLEMSSAKNARGQSKAQLKVMGLKYISDCFSVSSALLKDK